MSFAENLKERRIACRMTMESLAILVGTSRQTIQRYESGRIARPPYERIEALAAALGATPGELMGWANGDTTEDELYLSPTSDAALHYITVTDDAMDADRILERDIVHYRPDPTPPNGALVVLTWNGENMVRRLWHTQSGDILVASNTAYPPILVTPEDARRLTVLGAATVLRTLL